MRHSLLSRWLGSLLGSSLGEKLTLSRDASAPLWKECHQQGIKRLAETGQWQLSARQGEIQASETLLQHLPLLLFFHDQPQQWQEAILAIAEQQNCSQAAVSAMTAYATAMSWALREQVFGESLFSHLLATVAEESSYQTLQTLQTNLEKGETLQATQSQLSPTCQDIWLALYCFAATSEQLALSLRRGQTITAVSPFLLPLVGALSGGHNSISGIPIAWRCWLREEKQSRQPALEAMFATWSGSYEFARINQSLKQSAIAASQVIQPRKGSHGHQIRLNP